ncbi:antitoxin [Kitasatospora sp. NBC_01539]|uniref:antitoxin n=1 Tax=Kitasatospora sp. NBC_01539 TaxID=2903577 RepID=UPI0038601138
MGLFHRRGGSDPSGPGPGGSGGGPGTGPDGAGAGATVPAGTGAGAGGPGAGAELTPEAAAEELAALTREMEEGSQASRRRALGRATALVVSTGRALGRGGARTARATMVGGRATTERLLQAAPRIPVRDLATLRSQHPGAQDPEALADLLVTGATRASAAVGAGVGAAAMLPVPPAMAAEIAAETLVVAAVEIKLIAELHQVYGVPAVGTAAQRTTAYVTAWADRRGIDRTALTSPAGLTAMAGLAVGSEVRSKVRKRLTRSTLRKLPSMVPLMVGAALGATMNRRDTGRLAARVRSDLRKRGSAPEGYWEAAEPSGGRGPRKREDVDLGAVGDGGRTGSSEGGIPMSMLDKLKNMIKGHEDTARQGVDKAGDAVDAKTGNKYQGHVDTAQQKISDQLGEQPPEQR